MPITIGPFKQLQKRLRRYGIGVGWWSFISVAAGLTAWAAGLTVNWSGSVPPGLYIRSASGKWVEFCPPEPGGKLSMERHYREPGSCPDGGVPLLKPVVAGWGDWVEVSAAGVIVNAKLLPNTKPLVKDSQGRDLARYSGLRRGLWTVSTFDHRSFDSRYFGPIGEAAIRKRLRPWLVVDAASSPAQHKK